MTKEVSKTRKDTSHLFHLIMTILTCGLWGLFVWLPITVWHKTGPRRKTVTREQVRNEMKINWLIMWVVFACVVFRNTRWVDTR